MAIYGKNAESYREASRLTLFEIVGHSLISRLDDLRGKSVLDLACGAGNQTRRIKMAGAGRLVGVDISSAMIRLAREEERRDPLGIEYRCCAVQELGAIGTFDYVTAALLLHYASGYDDLLAMCRTIFANLRPGTRFVTINDNCGKFAEFPPTAFARYGLSIEARDPPLEEGGIITVTLSSEGNQVQFDNYYHARKTYERALYEAGFVSVSWSPLELPPHLASTECVEFWEFFLSASPLTVIECKKAPL